MKFAPTLSVSLRTELKLQPRQILHNELLVLPLMELEATLLSELQDNVFLEAVEKKNEGDDSAPTSAADIKMTPPGGDDEPAANGEEAAQDPGEMSRLFEYLNESRTSTSSVREDYSDELDPHARLSSPLSWRVQLAEAIRLERLSPAVLRAGEYMVESLDDRGFLTESLEEVADASEASLEEVEEALEVLQRAASPGIGARDLRERLLLMAQALQERSPTVERILKECYREFLEGKFDLVKKRLNIGDKELKGAIELLKELYHESPSIEEGEPATTVVPDATVFKDEDGQWKVRLHDEAVPQVRMSDFANKLARQEHLTDSGREYVVRAINRARWMMEALEQRRTTLRKILVAVTARQQDFFEFGHDALHPLRQEDISEEVQLHASTISRAVHEKYVSTPHGLMPLKQFFPRGVVTSGGSQRARNSVQDQLKALVDSEDPENPLSDDEIVDKLKRQGVKLSRRTVCKYRDELGIAPATRRKGIRKVFGPKGRG